MIEMTGLRALPNPFYGGGATSRRHRWLSRVIIAAGLGWSVIFIVAGLANDLQMYADGSLFSYAVAAQDAWLFHWHNISGRLLIYLYAYLPAETYVSLTGNPRSGIAVYGLLFFAAPLLGLLATFALDRSRNRIFFVFGCLSTACLCPLVFGFPTEMWVSHALFWPTLAACYDERRRTASSVITFVMMLALVMSHEGAVIFAAAIVGTVMLRGVRDAQFRRHLRTFAAVLAVWGIVKWTWPPDPYIAAVLDQNALNFISLNWLTLNITLQLTLAIGGFGAAAFALRRLDVAKPEFVAVGIISAVLTARWLWFDDALLADDRYTLRTALLLATPPLGALAAALAMNADDRITLFRPWLSRLITGVASAMSAEVIAGAVSLVMLVHAVETVKFVVAWNGYRSAVLALAMGHAADPALGSERFVSTDRIAEGLKRLAWSSTTDLLSVLVAPDFLPTRLVVDPQTNYFYLSCATTAANLNAARLIPVETRRLVWQHACQHR